jgi:acylphosphatase
MKKRIKATISGFVQGINFRYFCGQEASRLNLTGYARNIPGINRVEVIAEGEEADLEKLTDWLRHGPANAKVENVQVEHQVYSGEFSGFEIR